VQSLVSNLNLILAENQFWAGPIIGAIAAAESMFILGALVPATPLLLVTGGLIGAGTLDALPVLLWAITGATAGDVLSYWLGRRIGPGLGRHWPFNKYRETLARARLFFRRYGFASIFFGRYFGPVRCTVPLIAGMMAMPQKRFQIANVLSAIIWAPVVLAPGYLAAKGADRIGGFGQDHVGVFVIAATLFTIALTVLVSHIIARRSSQRPSRARRHARALAASGDVGREQP